MGVIYFKSVLIGVVVAVLFTVLWVLAEIGLDSLRLAWQMSHEAGSGGIGAVSVTSYAPIGTLLGFVSGFFWNVRRLKRKRGRSPIAQPH